MNYQSWILRKSNWKSWYQVFLQSSNKNVRSAERFSALHFMNQTVDVKRKGNNCAMFRRLCRNTNAQLFTEPFAQIQTNSCGLLNLATVLACKSLFKNTGQIGCSNPDSIVLHDKNNLILPFMSRNAENRLFRTLRKSWMDAVSVTVIMQESLTSVRQ